MLRHSLRKLVEFIFEPLQGLPVSVPRPRVAIIPRGGGRAAVAFLELGLEQLKLLLERLVVLGHLLGHLLAAAVDLLLDAALADAAERGRQRQRLPP